jgi:hypothetical protein
VLFAIDFNRRQEIASSTAVALARTGFVSMLLVGLMMAATGFASVFAMRASRNFFTTAGEAEVAPAATQQGVGPEANCGDGCDDKTHL